MWLAIGVGGAVGAMMRHFVNVALQGRLAVFPLGTFVINAVGCLAIGVVAGLVASGRVPLGEWGRLFLVVGVLGGFTTFSAYGLETFTLAREGHPGLAAVNAFGQLVVGMAAVWAGFSVAAWRP
jgi:CrcB protein